MSQLRLILFCLMFTGMLFAQKTATSAPSLQDIVNQVNSDSLLHFVKELSGVVSTNIGGTTTTIQSRNKNYPGNEQSAQYIRQKLASYGNTVNMQSFSTTGKNVIGMQIGTAFPNQKFMVCAHYDCMPTGATAPGADDNASGTAAVIEAARILKNYSFPFTILYALWDEEEQGLIGSEYYANAAAQAGDSILGVINLDMIAWERNNDNKFNLHARPVAASMDIAAKVTELNTSLAIGLVPVLKNPGITASDHASFWDANYSAVLLIEDDNNDFNSYYHTVNDKITEFNTPYFKKMSQLAIATLANYAMNLNIQIVHTPQPSAIVRDKIQLLATLQSGITIGSGASAPRLYYRMNSGNGFSAFESSTGVLETGNVYRFGLPYVPVGTSVQYYIAAQDSGSRIVVTSPRGGGGINPPGINPPATFHQFFVAPKTLLVNDSANALNRWTVAGTWGLSTTKYVTAPTSFTDSPTGQYGNSVTASITYSTPLQLGKFLGASLEFDAQWELESGYDYVQLQVSTNNGTLWTPLSGNYTVTGSGSFQPSGQPLYNGTQANWVHEKIDMTSYSGKNLLLRYLLKTDGSLTKDGFYIDNIALTGYQAVSYELYLYALDKSTDGSVSIRWQSSTELQNKAYIVERSSDNMHWETVSGLLHSSSDVDGMSFSFTDTRPLPGQTYYRVSRILQDGSNIPANSLSIESERPSEYRLEQNYPNPFNQSTIISYQLAKSGRITLKLYDMLGKELMVIANGFAEAGQHKVTLNTAGLPSGVYVYRIDCNDFRDMKKLILMK